MEVKKENGRGKQRREVKEKELEGKSDREGGESKQA